MMSYDLKGGEEEEDDDYVSCKSGRIYLDNNATTPMYKPALRAMMDAYKLHWGNPSGQYYEGHVAKSLLDKSRELFAKHLGHVPPETVYFTAGCTESNNIVVRSVLSSSASQGRNVIITSSIEHPSIKRTAEQCGFQHIQIPVDRKGYVRMDMFRDILISHRRSVGLVSIIMANNEIGTIQPISAISRMCREILGPNIPIHTDATQALGKYYIHPEKLGVDILTGSAHKFHGPKGVGIIYAKEGVLKPIKTTMTGGGQERGCRSGTENVPAIYAAAVAFAHMLKDTRAFERRVTRIRTLRDTLVASLVRKIPGLVLNGDPAKGLYTTLSLSFPQGHGHAICEYADRMGLSINSGSACSKGKPSETLTAVLGTSDAATKIAHGTIRISLSAATTISDCEQAAEILYKSFMATNEAVMRKLAQIKR